MRLRPVAFQIRNYKSIQDSGVCTLSADGITVLAGQNEAGKSSILEALDDFNTEIGKPSKRKDFIPDHSPDAAPSVGILFEVNWDLVVEKLASLSITIDPAFLDKWKQNDRIWLYRNPSDGTLSIPAEVAKHWPTQKTAAKVAEAKTAVEVFSEASPTYSNWLDISKALWKVWPSFVYFDAFDEILPREIQIDLVVTNNGGTSKSTEPTLPQSVKDFLTLSGIDLEKIRVLDKVKSEKKLRNYLNSKSAEVTGEFHQYWRQTVAGEQKVKLRAEHFRRDAGLYLAFYADDGTTMQYPNQRSKGFAWFLSFYLRLSASVAGEEGGRTSQFVLIDEPGSFLHQRAQRDILDVLEKRIAIVDVVMYSTHSPYMLPSSKMHRVRVVSKDKNGATFVADRLTDSRIQRDEKGDALSPVLAAIGLDVGVGSHLMREENFVVEGITDYYYLLAWAKLIKSDLFDNRGIIAAKGTKNIPNLVSLCLAWSRRFAVLVDRDDAGKAVRDELINTMNITSDSVVSFQDALMIEDLFSRPDFNVLLSLLDKDYKMLENDRPSTYIKRKKLDKVLLARKFAESVETGAILLEGLTEDTRQSVGGLLKTMEGALLVEPIFRIR